MPLNFNTINTKLAGKIITYLLNAKTDVYIAAEINHYISEGQIKGKANPAKLRAKELVLNKKHTKSYLIGLSFCQYGQNGMMDHLYAHMFLKGVKTKQKKELLNLIEETLDSLHRSLEDNNLTLPQYPEPHLRLVKPWLPIVVGNINPVKDYAQKYLDYTRQLSKKQVIEAIVDVQKRNIKNNNAAAKILLSDQDNADPKLELLRKTSKKFSKPELFIKSSANTLLSASRWDRWYKNTLSLLYRI